MPCIILDFDGEDVIARHIAEGGRTRAMKVVASKQELEDFRNQQEPSNLQVLCGSSMDFPGDYTTDKKLIAHVKELRGPSVWS